MISKWIFLVFAITLFISTGTAFGMIGAVMVAPKLFAVGALATTFGMLTVLKFLRMK